jgi:glycosyltransferase involved in cell wall biosynthesis
MVENRNPVIAFLTVAWQNVDDNIRRGEPPGGVPSVVRIWTTCLKNGFEVHVFIRSRTEPDWPKKTVELGGITFHWINPSFQRLTSWLRRKRLIGLFKPIWLLSQIKMIFRIYFSRVKPDVIYAMRSTFVMAGWFWSWKTGAKFVQRHYGVWSYDAWFNQKKWLPRINTLGELLCFKIPSDMCIVTNDGTGGQKLAEWTGFPMERFRFWINGVKKPLRIPDFDAAAFKERIGLTKETPMLMTLGRLTFWKRLDRVIDAMPSVFAEVPEARLVIAGGGELREDLEAQVGRLGLSDFVIFVGPVPHDMIKEYLNACDIFLILNDLTNMCSTLIEALTTGCCVLTRDVGSTTDIVTHDQNATVLKPGEADDISAAVLDLLKNPQKRKQLAEEAYKRSMKDFKTWEERIEMEVEEIMRLVTY